MAVITIRVSDEEKELLEAVAKFNGASLSEFVRTKSLNSAEDMLDLKTYKLLSERHRQQDESISHAEMLKELGL